MKDKFALLEDAGSPRSWLGGLDHTNGEYRCLRNWDGEWQDICQLSWTEDHIRSVASERFTLTLIDEDHPRFGEICAIIMKKELLG